MLMVRKGGGEEIPLVQGKEQWLRFAGAALKRYPTPPASRRRSPAAATTIDPNEALTSPSP